MLDNEVGVTDTVPTIKVKEEIKKLLIYYNGRKNVNVLDIIEIHKNLNLFIYFRMEMVE